MEDVRQVRECGDEDVVAGRGPGQRGWYQWIAPQVAGLTVLDAGCGLGYGLDILSRTAREVAGQDIDPQLADPRIRIAALDTFPRRSFDIVVSVDVIEHIQDDGAFVGELIRIARDRVILTTPNWTAGRGVWPYHVREYTPAQLRKLCEPHGRCTIWKGTPDGSEIYEIRWTGVNDFFNKARVTPIVSQAARAANLLAPRAARIHSHLAVVVDICAPSGTR
jgi:SAM-dependent methyltransferase